MNTRKRFKIVMLVFILIVVLVAIGHYNASNEIQTERAKVREDIDCVSAICIYTGVGDECFNVAATLSKISVVEDLNMLGAKRIIVEPTAKACGVARSGGGNAIP